MSLRFAGGEALTSLEGSQLGLGFRVGVLGVASNGTLEAVTNTTTCYNVQRNSFTSSCLGFRDWGFRV